MCRYLHVEGDNNGLRDMKWNIAEADKRVMNSQRCLSAEGVNMLCESFSNGDIHKMFSFARVEHF